VVDEMVYSGRLNAVPVEERDWSAFFKALAEFLKEILPVILEFIRML